MSKVEIALWAWVAFCLVIEWRGVINLDGWLVIPGTTGAITGLIVLDSMGLLR